MLYNNSEGEKELKSKIIVGADGPKSLVYQKIGNEFKAYNASQYLVKVNGIDEMSFVDLYPKIRIIRDRMRFWMIFWKMNSDMMIMKFWKNTKA